MTKYEGQYDFIVVGAGAGAAGSVLAAELSASGAQVLVVESGGPDEAPTIANPSIWFYNVGGPLDYHLPVNPSPRLNNRTFNMALGHVLGGGSSINAMVWTRGMQRDYDGWAKNGAKGWAFADVLPVFKSQEDWEGGANTWRGAGGPIHIRRPKHPHPTAPAFIDAAREMGMPILDDVNGPMVPGAGYINMNIAADGTRVSAVGAFLRPALSRPNLTLLLNATVVKLNFKGTRCVGVKIRTGLEVSPASPCRMSMPPWRSSPTHSTSSGSMALFSSRIPTACTSETLPWSRSLKNLSAAKPSSTCIRILHRTRLPIR